MYLAMLVPTALLVERSMCAPSGADRGAWVDSFLLSSLYPGYSIVLYVVYS